MTPSQALPKLIAEHRELARRVKEIEKILYKRLPVAAPKKAVQANTPKRKKDIRVLVQEMQKKYAGTTSLTKSLLAERRAEIAREEAEIRARFVRHRRARGQGKGPRTRRATTRSRAKQ
jgi:type III secretory pathway component EscV